MSNMAAGLLVSTRIFVTYQRTWRMWTLTSGQKCSDISNYLVFTLGKFTNSQECDLSIRCTYLLFLSDTKLLQWLEMLPQSRTDFRVEPQDEAFLSVISMLSLFSLVTHPGHIHISVLFLYWSGSLSCMRPTSRPEAAWRSPVPWAGWSWSRKWVDGGFANSAALHYHHQLNWESPDVFSCRALNEVLTTRVLLCFSIATFHFNKAGLVSL